MLYMSFFRFPVFEHAIRAELIVVSVAICTVAAVVGALAGVRSAVALPPAEGMRPPSPPVFKRLWLERLGLQGILPPALRMTMRNLERRPLRTIASIIGVALAAAILVVGTFAFDSAIYMSDLQFRHVEREDMTVAFIQARPERAVREVAHIKGVTRVEPFRSTPVRISSGRRDPESEGGRFCVARDTREGRSSQERRSRSAGR
jgi:putative ABC transport system permease protein